MNMKRFFWGCFGLFSLFPVTALGLSSEEKSNLIIRGLEFRILSGKDLKDHIIGRTLKMKVPVSGYSGTRYYIDGTFENLLEGSKLGSYRVLHNAVCEKRRFTHRDSCFQIIERSGRYYLNYLPLSTNSSPIEIYFIN